MPDPKPIQQRIDVVADTKGAEQVSRAMAELESRNKAEAQQVENATRAAQRKGQQLDRLRDRLRSLTAKEIEHERKVKSGATADKQASQTSQQRQRRVERLARALAAQEDRQEELNRRVKESVGAHRAAAAGADDASEATKKTSSSLEALGTSLGISTAGIAAMAASIIGAKGLKKAYQDWIENVEIINQRLKENAQLVRDNAEARLNFVALQGVEDPEDVKQIDSLATFAGRPPAEFARVFGILKSQFANESDENINKLAIEVAAAAQVSDAPAQGLAVGLSAIFRQNGDAQAAGNIFQQAIQEAGEADPARLGVEIGKLIGIAQQFGGLDTGEAAGFASAGTALGLPNEIATTGLKNVFLAIRGRGTPEGNELLGQLGIDRENVITALQQISEARSNGQISDAGLESIGGSEAAPVFAALADPARLSDFLASVGRVDRAEDFDGRIVTDKAEGIFTEGSIQAINLLIKQLESQTESTRAGDTRALEIDAARKALELRLAELEQNAGDAEEGVNAADITRILEEFDFQTGSGQSIEESLRRAVNEDDEITHFFRIPAGVPGIGGENVGHAFFPGADINAQSTFRDAEIVDKVLETIEEGPQIEAPGEDAGSFLGGGLINHGTIYMNTGDPLVDDLDGRDRIA